MDTLEFLQRVLPAGGHYVLTVINDGTPPQQRFLSTAEDLATACVGLDQAGHNVYYAVSSFARKGSRKQENVHQTRALFMDVDCGEGKPYADHREGAQALGGFLKATDLPRPMVVNSGRGLHVYWILDQDLPNDQWQPMANGLKALAERHGFQIDAKITADSARVLRPVGTHNPKNGAEVRLLMDAPAVPVSTLENILLSVEPTPSVTGVPGVSTSSPKRGLSALASAATGGIGDDYPKAVAGIVASKCKQIKWGVENQSEVSEPFWYAMLGVAAHTTDPEDTARAWSDQYPGYDETATLNKMAQWVNNTTGPATCKAFQDERSKGCDGCPFRNKITSPAHVGVQFVEAGAAQDAPADVATDVELPMPFQRAGSAGQEFIVQNVDGTHVKVCDFDIYPVGYGMDEAKGYETVRYKWRRKHVGWCDLTLRQAYLTEDHREFATALADQGIVLGGKKQTGTFQFMLRSYMDKLREARTVTNFYSTMGWKEDFTRFVIGERLYTRNTDGSVTCEETATSSALSKQMRNMYSRKGTAEAWVRASSILEKAKLYPQMFAVMQGFAAPLWALTGLKGITISLSGPTGGGKSLAQIMQQSIWGDPAALHFSAKFTQNTLFHRLGLYNNLPMTIDEATMMDDREVGDFCYWVTQGRDKARLNRSAEEREARTWSTVVTVSTNVSLAAKMLNTGMDSDAQMARLLEINVPAHPLFAASSDAGKKLYNFCASNHGWIGHLLAMAYLRLGKEELVRRIEKHAAEFGTKYNVKFTGSERFYEQALVLVDVAGTIAKEEGLIGFDHELCLQFMVGHLDLVRRQVEDGQRNSFDLVDEYMMEHRDQLLVVMHTDSKPMMDHTSLPRGSVLARIDLYRDSAVEEWSHGTLMITRAPFRRWLAARGFDYNQFMRSMRLEGVDATPSSKKFSFGKDTGLKGIGQDYVIGLNLNHPNFAHYREKYAESADDLTFGRMKLVSQSD